MSQHPIVHYLKTFQGPARPASKRSYMLKEMMLSLSQRRLAGDLDGPSISSPAAPTPGNRTPRMAVGCSPKLAVSEEREKREPRKPVFDKIRSSLLQPTKAFLVGRVRVAMHAYVSGRYIQLAMR